MTYHPAKVIEVYNPKDKEVIGSDETVQATLEMWDENIFTFLVSPKLANRIKKEDVVLVDYKIRPSSKIPVPPQIIIKILKGQKAKQIWQRYKNYYKKKKPKKHKEVPMPAVQQPQRTYAG